MQRGQWKAMRVGGVFLFFRGSSYLNVGRIDGEVGINGKLPP
jgi:hypothetical protein